MLLSLLAASSDLGPSCQVVGFDRARRCSGWSWVVARHGFRRSSPLFPLPFSSFGCSVPICFRQIALRILAARFLCGLRSRSAGVCLPRSAPVSLKLFLEFADLAYQWLGPAPSRHCVVHKTAAGLQISYSKAPIPMGPYPQTQKRSFQIIPRYKTFHFRIHSKYCSRQYIWLNIIPLAKQLSGFWKIESVLKVAA